MIVKTYGLYDGVAEHIVQTFTSDKDETAIRSCEYILHDKNADIRKLKDCVLMYLYAMDTSTGEIVDVQKKTILAFASLIESQGIPEFDSNSYDKVVNQINDISESVKQCEIRYSTIAKNLMEFEKVLNSTTSTLQSLLKGEIKCQKKKK